jgi:hypothetical protein
MKGNPMMMDLRGEWAFSLGGRSLDDSISLPGTTGLCGKGRANPSKETQCLTPAYPYVGEAWYAREITIPDAWVDKRITLFIERTKSSKAWLDDVELGGISERLSTPHVYELPADTSPGRHRLTVMIDNEPRLVRDVSHAVSENTQGNWNGMIGRLELRATARVFIDRVKVTPRVEERRAEVEATVRNGSCQDWSGAIQLQAEAFNTDQVHAVSPRPVDVTVAAGATEVVTLSLEMGDGALLWDEFSPALYRLATALTCGEEVLDTQIREFGMRSFSTKGLQFTINGRPTFLRGKHDACVFPETGHPPTDVAGWLRVMGIARDYGINHYRFHSWCPPEAAFAAADRLGIYLQPELSNGSLMKEEPEYGAALREEAEQILSCYADHASFVMFSLGNELRSESDNLDSLARDVRAMDDRPLHAWGSNNFFQEPREHPGDDFWVTFRTRRDAGGNCRASYAHSDPPPGHIETGPPGTRHNYTAALSGVTMPVVGHETGQFQVYPNFPRELPAFQGAMRPHNLQAFRDRAVEQGWTEGDMEARCAASGALAVLCYREDIEAALRTPNFGGFQLLDLQDYPGQGTAMVGVLDSFMESKGLITPEAWRRFCCETVPLARFDSYTWTREQRFEADLQVAHYGPAPLEDATLSWRVADENGAVIRSGTTEPKTVVGGAVADLGRIEIELAALVAPAKYTLCLVLDNTAYCNDYPLWVYPDDDGADPADRSDLSIAGRLNADTLALLEKGGTVLLVPDKDELVDSVGGLFQCDFWCFPMFKAGSERRGMPVSPGTLGIRCDPKHPLFAAFPTECHSNWQWWHIVKNARPMVMDALPQDVKPVIAVTDNIHRAHRLGLLVEAKMGRGKLLICSVDREAIVREPAGRQFWQALCEYAGSDRFDPQQALEASQLASLLRMKGQT